jgi:hypothetical protein
MQDVIYAVCDGQVIKLEPQKRLFFISWNSAIP